MVSSLFAHVHARAVFLGQTEIGRVSSKEGNDDGDDQRPYMAPLPSVAAGERAVFKLSRLGQKVWSKPLGRTLQKFVGPRLCYKLLKAR